MGHWGKERSGGGSEYGKSKGGCVRGGGGQTSSLKKKTLKMGGREKKIRKKRKAGQDEKRVVSEGRHPGQAGLFKSPKERDNLNLDWWGTISLWEWEGEDI